MVTVGKTYECVGGWWRRVTNMREHRGQREVRYASSRDRSRLRQQLIWNPLQWFEAQVLWRCPNCQWVDFVAEGPSCRGCGRLCPEDLWKEMTA